MSHKLHISESLPTGDGLLNYWMNFPEFGLCHRTIIKTLADHPNGLGREKLCEASGYQWSGSTQNALGALRTAGVIVGKNNEIIRLSDELL